MNTRARVARALRAALRRIEDAPDTPRTRIRDAHYSRAHGRVEHFEPDSAYFDRLKRISWKSVVKGRKR